MSQRRGLRVVIALSVALTAVSVGAWNARAAGSLADRARALLAELDADPSAKELVAAAAGRANAALGQAAAASEPTRAELHEAVALQWAEVARDLRRAREAEVASDQLEREASAIQTELVRSHAAVEQAMARVGRARQGLAELEAAAAEAPSNPKPNPKAAPAPRGPSE